MALRLYYVYFTRSNGTKGDDVFTAMSKTEATNQFYQCYRHDTYTNVLCVDACDAYQAPNDYQDLN